MPQLLYFLSIGIRNSSGVSYMPKPRVLLTTGIALVIIAVLIGGLIYWQADAKDRSTFWSNTGLNLAVEFMGIGIGLGIPLVILGINAKKEFENTATQVAELVAQLRAEGTISKEAARKSIVCAVNVIPKEHISRDANNRFSTRFEESYCDVCDLKIRIGTDKKCDFCQLEKHVWKIKNRPVMPPTFSIPPSE